MTNKFHAIKVKEDGYVFDSKAEFKRYCELKLLIKANKIHDLTVHPKFPAFINEVKICTIEMDFSYRESNTGILVTEDVKGKDNPMSRLKRKIAVALFPEMNLQILTAQ